ncbi:MAG: hypothetical protein JNJ91_02845 [Flavobacteriales bacterium]|nr:hypothetical protein [Flavobacteriales bacterium]
MKELRDERDNVWRLLAAEYGTAPVRRVGGSGAKGTMNKEDFDLDLPYYFPRDDDSAGDTLKEIYESVEGVLSKEYRVERKGVAVRLHDKEGKIDFHIDVVPGRFVNGSDGDAFLFPATSGKERLQTNLEEHIAHVKNSGVIDEIRLGKLWRTRKKIQLKTFALELLIIDILSGFSGTLAEKLEKVLIEFRDNSENLSISDPANTGNDLSGMLTTEVRNFLKSAARDTLNTVRSGGWKAVFGEIQEESSNEVLRRISLASPISRPWGYHE